MPKEFSAVIKRRNPRPKNALFRKGVRGIIFSKVFLLFLFIVLGLTILFYYFFISNKFLVTRVEISGASVAVEVDIRDYIQNAMEDKILFVLKRDKTTLFPQGKVSAELIPKIPEIKKIDISIFYPDGVKIKIEERTQRGIWCDYTLNIPTCYFYDEGGIIYQAAPNSVAGSLIIPIRDKRELDYQLGAEVLDASTRNFIEELSEALGFAYEKPFYITIENNYEIRTGFALNWEAYFSIDRSAFESIENLILVIKEEIGPRVSELEYIDLRLGNKVFYKYKE